MSALDEIIETQKQVVMKLQRLALEVVTEDRVRMLSIALHDLATLQTDASR